MIAVNINGLGNCALSFRTLGKIPGLQIIRTLPLYLETHTLAAKMHRQTHDSTCLRALVGIALLAGRAAAVCIGWEQKSESIQTAYSYSSRDTQVVDQLACPADAKADCLFDRKSYDITIDRHIVGDVFGTWLDLPDEEADGIFKLAQDGFNKAIKAIYRDDDNRNQSYDFITRKATVTTSYLLSDDSILEVEPAINKSLAWVPFSIYSTGVLSNCSNGTLNDWTVTATASYLKQDKALNNMTVMAGTWAASSSNATDQPNGAPSLVKRSTSSVIAGLMVVTMILAFV
ncbi:hypothetical protein BJ170DRAFT_625965, partial [Xylariales sp. AK1849]